MVHEDYQELLSARALSSLAAEDERTLDSHLEGCDECRAELTAWEQTAALLALGDSVSFAPSAKLREKILASVRLETSESTGEKQANSAASPGVTQSESRGESRDESRVLAFEPPHRTGFFSGSIRSYGAIAAGVVITALLISLFVLWQQNRKAQAELARSSAQMDEAKSQLARQREAMELLTSPGARMASLAGTSIAPAAHAMIAYDKKGHAMLMARGLPAAPKGMAYQLWFIVDSKPMPGKTLTVDETGNGVLTDDLPREAMGSAVFAITLEPAGGVPTPTGKMYLTSG